MIRTELDQTIHFARDQIVLLGSIAVINLRSGKLHLPKILNDIYYMSEQVLGMFQRALTAFIQEDAQAAPYGSGRGADRRAVFAGLCRSIDLVSHPYNMQRGNYVLCVAHNLERTADRVTNVRERMLFIATGELSEISNTLRHPVRY